MEKRRTEKGKERKNQKEKRKKKLTIEKEIDSWQTEPFNFLQLKRIRHPRQLNPDFARLNAAHENTKERRRVAIRVNVRNDLQEINAGYLKFVPRLIALKRGNSPRVVKTVNGEDLDQMEKPLE